MQIAYDKMVRGEIEVCSSLRIPSIQRWMRVWRFGETVNAFEPRERGTLLSGMFLEPLASFHPHPNFQQLGLGLRYLACLHSGGFMATFVLSQQRTCFRPIRKHFSLSDGQRPKDIIVLCTVLIVVSSGCDIPDLSPSAFIV